MYPVRTVLYCTALSVGECIDLHANPVCIRFDADRALYRPYTSSSASASTSAENADVLPPVLNAAFDPASAPSGTHHPCMELIVVVGGFACEVQ